jgi:hypothetical protein
MLILRFIILPVYAMNKSTKAALLSALVFPGVGHFSLRRHWRGMLFFLPALTSLLFQIYYVFTEASVVVSQVESSPEPFDISALSILASGLESGNQLFLMNFSSWVLLVCWLAGMIDAYQLGNIPEKTVPPDRRRQ